ncbi:MAG TPA: ATP-binding protein [Streptosporangiaceae bacterium]|nr:ATP-binding protein [Streptosporangiaceae bacterium]
MTTTGGGELTGPWYRVLAIEAARGASSPESDFVAVLPAVLSAAEHGRAFVVGWLSRGGGAPLELITNAAGPGEAGLLFPPGARGEPAGGRWRAELDEMVWTSCPGRPAPPLASEQQSTLFESTLVSLMSHRFGWLVVAEPTEVIDAEVAELRTQLNVLRRYEEERSRLDVERAQRRMAELDSFREAGLWSVRVLAGAATAGELRLLAPMLVGSVDLGRHPYRLRSGIEAVSLAGALSVKAQDASDGAVTPFTATAGVLAALTGLPRREVPGLRVLDHGHFDLTSETAAQEPVIELGAILDGQDRPVGTFRLPLATLNRHAFITGATGAGKSQTVRHILEQCARAGLPWLAIEPAKSEYAAMAGRIEGIGQVTVVNPADPQAVPLSVNPLAPEPGYPVQAHIDMVRALFQAAFATDEPFPQIMSQALQRVYEQAGWDVVTGAGLPGAPAHPAIPTLAELQRAALEVIDEVGYGRELQADVRGFVDVRLRSLRVGSAGRFFEGGHPADIAGLLRRNVVLAIEDVANDEDKAFLIGTLIIRLVEHLRLRARRERAGGLRHVIVIEEAHRLLRDRRAERAAAHAVELFAGMLAEIRAYGEGIVVAEQIPAKLVPDVVKNTALKIVHRLPAQDDRQIVGAAMNLDGDQSRQVVSLQPGVAAVFADGMDRPLRIRVPFGEDAERLGAAAVTEPPLRGRRSAACGPRCAMQRACTLAELRGADLLAADPASAWLRIWTETLLLAFLTSRPLPAVPRRLHGHWAGLEPRLRECVLATLIDRSVSVRAASVRASYDPLRLAASACAAALRLLDGGGPPGVRTGPNWVVPQLRWLHEVERVCPLAGAPSDPLDRAAPLDFDLAGAVDWPNMRAGHRIHALRCHPLSMELEGNRLIAWNLLLGADDHRGYTGDLAIVAVGRDPGTRLGYAAAEMAVRGWLEVVLSWPRRFIAGEFGKIDDSFTVEAGLSGW